MLYNHLGGFVSFCILVSTSFSNLTVPLQTFSGQYHRLVTAAKEKTIHELYLMKQTFISF